MRLFGGVPQNTIANCSFEGIDDLLVITYNENRDNIHVAAMKLKFERIVFKKILTHM